MRFLYLFPFGIRRLNNLKIVPKKSTKNAIKTIFYKSDNKITTNIR